MMRYHADIVPRDDNMFDVVSGDFAASPFPTIAFAMQIASGENPAPADNIGVKFRRFRIVREASNASA
jgi:hypothetical protein